MTVLRGLRISRASKVAKGNREEINPIGYRISIRTYSSNRIAIFNIVQEEFKIVAACERALKFLRWREAEGNRRDYL